MPFRPEYSIFSEGATRKVYTIGSLVRQLISSPVVTNKSAVYKIPDGLVVLQGRSNVLSEESDK